jgi:cytoskeleton protein RodZ
MMARKSKEEGEQLGLTEQNDAQQHQAEQTYQETGGTSAHSKCGGALRAARESQGLSVHEIASRLRLSPKQIEAIEADNFATLPEATIVRGFIRNYAKQLKINAQPLLDAYVVIVPSAAPYEMAVKPTSDMKISGYEKSKSGRYALAALALLLGLGVWLFYQHYVAKPSPTQPSSSANDAGENVTTESGTNAPVEAVLPEAALPAAERAPEPVATDTQTSTALTLPAANSSTSPVVNPVAPAPAVTVPTPAAPNVSAPSVQLPNSQLTASTTLSAPQNNASADALEPPPAPMPKGVAKLEFNATQETWVNVVDANGREVYSKIIFAGSRESIDVKPPVNVTVGNAGGTSMSMNGRPVELAPHSRNNVAHIKLNN